jgi:hydrogenase maturation protease
MHLAYELVSGYDRAILIDALPRGGKPGTLYVVEPEVRPSGTAPDAHRMDLENVFAFVRTIGAEPPPITILGCEPSAAEEAIGLSAAVQAAVQRAAELVRRLVRDTVDEHDSQEKRSPVWTEA